MAALRHSDPCQKCRFPTNRSDKGSQARVSRQASLSIFGTAPRTPRHLACYRYMPQAGLSSLVHVAIAV